MLYRWWQIVLVAVMCCALGINYTYYTWLDYEILGISKGRLSTSLQIWGYILLALGLLLFATLAARKKINVKMIDKQLEIFIALIFVLQLPIISLWFMATFMQGIEALPGGLLHLLLLGLAAYSFLSNHHMSDKQHSYPNDTGQSS